MQAKKYEKRKKTIGKIPKKTSQEDPSEVFGLELLSTKEVADFLGIHANVLAKWRKENAGPPFIAMSSRHFRYSKVDVLEWLESRTIKPGEEQKCVNS